MADYRIQTVGALLRAKIPRLSPSLPKRSIWVDRVGIPAVSMVVILAIVGCCTEVSGARSIVSALQCTVVRSDVGCTVVSSSVRTVARTVAPHCNVLLR